MAEDQKSTTNGIEKNGSIFKRDMDKDNIWGDWNSKSYGVRQSRRTAAGTRSTPTYLLGSNGMGDPKRGSILDE